MLTTGTSVILEIKEWKTNQGSFSWLINFEVQLYWIDHKDAEVKHMILVQTTWQGLFIFHTF